MLISSRSTRLILSISMKNFISFSVFPFSFCYVRTDMKKYQNESKNVSNNMRRSWLEGILSICEVEVGRARVEMYWKLDKLKQKRPERSLNWQLWGGIVGKWSDVKTLKVVFAWRFRSCGISKRFCSFQVIDVNSKWALTRFDGSFVILYL